MDNKPASSAPAFVSHDDALAQWARELSRLGTPPKSIKKRVARMRGLFRARKWPSPANVDRAAVVAALTDLRDLGRSVKTVETLLSELVTFFGWCVADGIVNVNPAEGIKRAKRGVTGGISNRRGARALTPDEVARLIEAARRDEAREKPRFRKPRSYVYHVAYLTGGRLGQLTLSLRWQDVDVHGEGGKNPAVIFDADDAKNGRSWRIPLTAEAVAVLKEWGERVGIWRGLAQPCDFVFRFRLQDRIVNADLAAAGIPKRGGPTGRAASFHSLRKSYCTSLVVAGVAPAVAQRLMQHRTIEQTMRVYAEVRDEHLATAIDRLPPVFAPGVGGENLSSCTPGGVDVGWAQAVGVGPLILSSLNPIDPEGCPAASAAPQPGCQGSKGRPSGAIGASAGQVMPRAGIAPALAFLAQTEGRIAPPQGAETPGVPPPMSLLGSLAGEVIAHGRRLDSLLRLVGVRMTDPTVPATGRAHGVAL